MFGFWSYWYVRTLAHWDRTIKMFDKPKKEEKNDD